MCHCGNDGSESIINLLQVSIHMVSTQASMLSPLLTLILYAHTLVRMFAGACCRDELLWLRFAGIKMKDLQKSSVWLHTHLAGRAVTFVPVLVCDKELVSIIYIKVKCVCVCVCMWLSYVIPPPLQKRLRRVSVNSELVVKGLAQPDKLDELPSSKEVLTFVHRLLASDLRAKRWRWWPW